MYVANSVSLSNKSIAKVNKINVPRREFNSGIENYGLYLHRRLKEASRVSAYPNSEFDFDEEAEWCAIHFGNALKMHREIDVAYYLNEAIESFQKLRNASRGRLQFTNAQRDALLKGLSAAHLSVNLNCSGGAREFFIPAVRSIQELVVHFALPRECRVRSSDDEADLIAIMRLGQNTARNFIIIHEIKRREERRRASRPEEGEQP